MAGRTPDRHHGVEEQEGTVYYDDGIAASQEGEIRYNGGAFSFYDSVGVYDPRSGGGGISEAQHEALDTLVHNLAETSYEEITRSGGQVTDVVVWTTSGKTTKVRETNITRSGGQLSQIVHKHYDGTGTIIAGQTLTGTVTRVNGQLESIDWVQT